jgi:hypothetical protein
MARRPGAGKSQRHAVPALAQVTLGAALRAWQVNPARIEFIARLVA